LLARDAAVAPPPLIKPPSLHGCAYEVIERTFRNAKTGGREVSLWVMNRRAHRRLA
jgi:hypothetical protein